MTRDHLILQMERKITNMKISDILGMSLTNLWRRKMRTLLTVLGVIIGTASIVVMLSLGIGLKQAMVSQVSSAGGLTEIRCLAVLLQMTLQATTRQM